jgi:acetyl-CoA carboxylase carboxyl transferase subunit beta
MSWLEKLLPPKIQHTDPAERRTVPEGLWIKCPSCETVLYKTDLEQNQNVCPTCSHHHRISARARLNLFLDNEGRFEVGQEVLPVDALKFKDSRNRRPGGDGRGHPQHQRRGGLFRVRLHGRQHGLRGG